MSEPAVWCLVNYYELDTQIGDSYTTSNSTFIIDGYTSSYYKDRYCLGCFSNIKRDEVTIKTRRYIGSGLRIFKTDSNVYVQCLSNYSIFVQSPSSNLRNGLVPMTVTKVIPGTLLDLFDYKDFGNRLEETVRLHNQDIDQLYHLCIIRISFVKGWGPEYRRPFITNTPCWVEVHLKGPSLWIDNVIRCLGVPPGVAHSDS